MGISLLMRIDCKTCTVPPSLLWVHLQEDLSLARPLRVHQRDLGQDGGPRRHPGNATRFSEGITAKVGARRYLQRL